MSIDFYVSERHHKIDSQLGFNLLPLFNQFETFQNLTLLLGSQITICF